MLIVKDYVVGYRACERAHIDFGILFREWSDFRCSGKSDVYDRVRVREISTGRLRFGQRG